MKPTILQIDKHELRPYSLKDESRFVEMNLDEKVIKYMDGASGEVEKERALFQKIFQLYMNTSTKRIFHIWGIYEGAKLCGHLELKETEHTSATELELVYIIHPTERGQGIMTKVLRFLKQNQTIWQKNIIATVHPQNKASISLLEKWGIQQQLSIGNDGDKYLKIWLTK